MLVAIKMIKAAEQNRQLTSDLLSTINFLMVATRHLSLVTPAFRFQYFSCQFSAFSLLVRGQKRRNRIER